MPAVLPGIYQAGARSVSEIGSAGNYVSTPDSVAVSITGDIDIRMAISLADWTPAGLGYVVSKYAGAGSRSWLFGVAADGTLQYEWSVDGTALETARNSSVATGIADGSQSWIRVTHDVDNGSGQNTVRFFLSGDGSTWTQLGTDSVAAGTTSIFDSAAAIEFPGFSNGAGGLPATVYGVQLRNGIDGTLVANFDPKAAGRGRTTVLGSTGEVWTLNGTAALI